MTTTRINKYADALETTPAYLMGWLEEDEIQKQYGYELTASRFAAYNMRDFWAWHILEVGDNLPKAGVEEILNFADYLASKYKITNLTTEEQLPVGVPSSILE